MQQHVFAFYESNILKLYLPIYGKKIENEIEKIIFNAKDSFQIFIIAMHISL